MIYELSGMISGLKTAYDMAEALIGLRDSAIAKAKVLELQGVIMNAQRAALDANAAQSSLLDRIRQLEQEVAELKAWGAEKERYKLTDVGAGAVAYVLKSEEGSAEPGHALCPNCYHDGRKAILQPDAKSTRKLLRCLRCKAEILVGENAAPAWSFL